MIDQVAVQDSNIVKVLSLGLMVLFNSAFGWLVTIVSLRRKDDRVSQWDSSFIFRSLCNQGANFVVCNSLHPNEYLILVGSAAALLATQIACFLFYNLTGVGRTEPNEKVRRWFLG
jgi:hypothetical protein